MKLTQEERDQISRMGVWSLNSTLDAVDRVLEARGDTKGQNAEMFRRGWMEWEFEVPESRGCGICGGRMALIRGKHPGEDQREVCPTCLADRMDLIRTYSDSDYGQAPEGEETE